MKKSTKQAPAADVKPKPVAQKVSLIEKALKTLELKEDVFALNSFAIKKNAQVEFIEVVQKAITENDKEMIERIASIMKHQSGQVASRGVKIDQQVLSRGAEACIQEISKIVRAKQPIPTQVFWQSCFTGSAIEQSKQKMKLIQTALNQGKRSQDFSTLKSLLTIDELMDVLKVKNSKLVKDSFFAAPFGDKIGLESASRMLNLFVQELKFDINTVPMFKAALLEKIDTHATYGSRFVKAAPTQRRQDDVLEQMRVSKDLFLEKLSFFVNMNDFGFFSITQGKFVDERIEARQNQASKGLCQDGTDGVGCPPEKQFFQGYCVQCCIARKFVHSMKLDSDKEVQFMHQAFSMIKIHDDMTLKKNLMMLHTRAQTSNEQQNQACVIAQVSNQMISNVFKFI